MSCLAATGRTAEAVQQMEQVLELDPLSPFHSTIAGLAFHFDRRYEEAIEQYRNTLELHPQYPLLQLCLGWTYEQQAMIPTAIEAFRKRGSSADLVQGNSICSSRGGAWDPAVNLARRGGW